MTLSATDAWVILLRHLISLSVVPEPSSYGEDRRPAFGRYIWLPDAITVRECQTLARDCRAVTEDMSRFSTIFPTQATKGAVCEHYLLPMIAEVSAPYEYFYQDLDFIPPELALFRSWFKIQSCAHERPGLSTASGPVLLFLMFLGQPTVNFFSDHYWFGTSKFFSCY